MSDRRYLIILLKIFFIFSSLQFLEDAFFKWDGYSYYMRFIDFLPDLSLMKEKSINRNTIDLSPVILLNIKEIENEYISL